VRLHNRLFTTDNPDAHPSGFLSAINSNSEERYPHAMVDIGLEETRRNAPWPKSEGEKKQQHHTNSAGEDSLSPECVRFQGMRVGYFCLDRDSSDKAVVLNRIVTLKEDAKK
jgi:glutaminyl-tRNA synthetase